MFPKLLLPTSFEVHFPESLINNVTIILFFLRIIKNISCHIEVAQASQFDRWSSEWRYWKILHTNKTYMQVLTSADMHW